MKVIVLTPNYPRKGFEVSGIFIHQQVKALCELGVECHVLLLHNWYPPFNLHTMHIGWQSGFKQKQSYFDIYEGVRIHHIPVKMKKPDRLFKGDYQQSAARAIERYIRKNKALSEADWLYAHFFIEEGYIASLVAEKIGIRLAVIARGDDIHTLPYKSTRLQECLHHVMKKADVLMANSSALANDAMAWMDAESKKPVQVVYNGIDYHKFHPGNRKNRNSTLEKHGLDVNLQYLVCISTPVEPKGWLELLNAIKILESRLDGWKLLIIAPVKANKGELNLLNIAEELSIAHLVHNMGQLSHEDVVQVLGAADVFVLPSHNEGMANALLEAMSSGLACITTNVGGHSEVIEDGVTGLLIPAKSKESMADAIAAVIEDVDLRKRMGVAARERMIAFGDYKDNARKLLNILEQYSKEE